MSPRVEFRVFCLAIGLLLVIPLVAGLTGAFAGPAGMARLFGEDDRVEMSPVVRNNFRAICFMFFAWVPLLLWELADLPARAGAFRVAIGCAFLAGFARLTGYLVDGYPGVAPVVFMGLELAGMPLLLLWHTRLVGRCRK